MKMIELKVTVCFGGYYESGMLVVKELHKIRFCSANISHHFTKDVPVPSFFVAYAQTLTHGCPEVEIFDPERTSVLGMSGEMPMCLTFAIEHGFMRFYLAPLVE